MINTCTCTYEAGALRVTAAPSVGNSIRTDLREWVSNSNWRKEFIDQKETENMIKAKPSLTCSAAMVLIGLHLYRCVMNKGIKTLIH